MELKVFKKKLEQIQTEGNLLYGIRIGLKKKVETNLLLEKEMGTNTGLEL